MPLKKILALAGLVGLIIVGRVADHPANFAPVAAVALLVSAYFGLRYAWLASIGGLFLSDAIIGFYDWRLMAFVYGSFVSVAFLGQGLNRRSPWADILSTSIFASLIFFFITNAAVWYLTPAYSKDLAGLFESYFMGLPFLRNTLVGDMFYTAGLFGAARGYCVIRHAKFVQESAKILENT